MDHHPRSAPAPLACFDQLPGWFQSDEPAKFGRFLKGAGKTIIDNINPLTLVQMYNQFTHDPIGTVGAALHMPIDMANGMLTALRTCDYEAMGELSANLGLLLYGGAELGVGLVDLVEVRPRGTPNSALALSAEDQALLERLLAEDVPLPTTERPGYKGPSEGFIRKAKFQNETITDNSYITLEEAIKTARDTGTSKEYLYVITKDGEIRLGHVRKQHHSFMVNGDNVYGAGELEISDRGRMIYIDDASGHYHTDSPFGLQFYDYFESLLKQKNIHVDSDVFLRPPWWKNQ